MIRLKEILPLGPIFFILLGCTSPASQHSPISIMPSSLPASQEVNATEITPTETPVLTTRTPFPTPIPTLETALARQRVNELFETNNNCRLPCWWGITPGKTTWDDALKILAPISLDIETDYPWKPTKSIYVKIISPTADVNVYGSYLSQYYFVENNVVKTIDINSSYDLATHVYFKTFLRENGLPTQFYIHGYSEPYLDNWLFQMALFYPQKGMMLEYDTKPQVVENYLDLCWGEAKSAIIHLWSPKDSKTFDEVIEALYPPGSTDLPPYKSFEDVGINLDEFIHELNNVNSPSCINIPKSMLSP